MTEQTIEDLRRTTRALRPIYLEDLGLVAALEMLARETENSANVQVSFTLQGNERRLPQSVELALYRIAQEALSNVSRHAHASRATLSIGYDDETLTLQVTDNGLGFQVPNTPSEFAPAGHFGLLGLYERSDLIGASLKIKSEVGNGTQLTVQLPLSQFFFIIIIGLCSNCTGYFAYMRIGQNPLIKLTNIIRMVLLNVLEFFIK